MARGWESKSVEEQQSEFRKAGDESGKKARSKEEMAQAQRVQALELARTNVRQQMERSQSERHKEMLRSELAHLDEELERLANLSG